MTTIVTPARHDSFPIRLLHSLQWRPEATSRPETAKSTRSTRPSAQDLRRREQARREQSSAMLAMMGRYGGIVG